MHRLLIILLVVKFGTLSAKPSQPVAASCAFKSLNYSLTWHFDELSNDVVFSLSTPATRGSFWTAVAFGDGKPTDAVVVFVRSGQVGLLDATVDEQGNIDGDETTNVQSLGFDVDNGMLTAQFARPLVTDDNNDANLETCTTMFVTPESIAGDDELRLPTDLVRLRLCDITVTCPSSSSISEIAKREVDSSQCQMRVEGTKNVVSWHLLRDRKVVFTVNQGGWKGRWWTAIGFGERMENLDMLVAFAENGQLRKVDVMQSTGYGPPQTSDRAEEVNVTNEKTEDGRLTYSVQIDKDFVLSKADSDGCTTVQISVLGGQYTPQFAVRKHSNTPIPVRICPNLCAEQSEIEASGAEANEADAPRTEEAKAVPAVDETARDELLEKVAEPVAEQNKDGQHADDVVEGSGDVEQRLDAVIADNGNKTISEDEQAVNVTTTSPLAEPLNPGAEDGLLPVVDQTAQSKGCGETHEDLRVCGPYFEEYLGKVQQWSTRHNMTVAAHMWKACSLLSQVQHVPTLCCRVFRDTCATHLLI